MEIVLSNRFLKSINNLDKEFIKKKLELFVEQLSKDSNNFTSVPKGYWVQRFSSNPNRFKFRVSNKDRIIYELSEDKQIIYFLEYCNHDTQNRIVNRIPVNFSKLEIDKSKYEESIEEDKYDEILTKENYNLPSKEELIKEKLKNDFNNENNRIQVVLYSDNRIWARDILKILNRIYTEYRIIPGNYIKVSTENLSNLEIYLSESNFSDKIVTNYLKDFVNNIINKIDDNFYYKFELHCCFYSIKDKELYTDYKSFEANMNRNTLEASECPEVHLILFNGKYINISERNLYQDPKSSSKAKRECFREAYSTLEEDLKKFNRDFDKAILLLDVGILAKRASQFKISIELMKRAIVLVPYWLFLFKLCEVLYLDKQFIEAQDIYYTLLTMDYKFKEDAMDGIYIGLGHAIQDSCLYLDKVPGRVYTKNLKAYRDVLLDKKDYSTLSIESRALILFLGHIFHEIYDMGYRLYPYFLMMSTDKHMNMAIYIFSKDEDNICSIHHFSIDEIDPNKFLTLELEFEATDLTREEADKAIRELFMNSIPYKN